MHSQCLLYALLIYPHSRRAGYSRARSAIIVVTSINRGPHISYKLTMPILEWDMAMYQCSIFDSDRVLR